MKKTTILIFLTILSFSLIAQTEYPGFNIIGKGYNIFGEFANNKSIERYSLFDFSKMQEKKNAYGHTIPNFIIIDNVSDHIIKTVEGSSMKEYINNLSANIGFSTDAFFFKASVESQFNNTKTQTSDIFYYTYMDINTKWRISLDIRNLAKLIEYLDPQFKIDLENLAPKELFELYGTHFITDAYLGGRIDYSSFSEISSKTNTTDLKIAIDAQYKIISGNGELNIQNSEMLKTNKTTTKLNVVGGNSEFSNNINDNEQYKIWANGIKKSPALCGFDNKSLKPLWILTNNEQRKKELQNYFNEIILPKYPLPTFFKKDDILDNTNLTQKFNITILGFKIKQDCDAGTYLAGDENGEFEYKISVFVNKKWKRTFQTGKNSIKAWSGESLKINEDFQVEVPLSIDANIHIYWKLTEIDTYTENEEVGNDSKIHKIPFAAKDLYNRKDKQSNALYWEARLWKDEKCNAVLLYKISPIKDKTANEFGSKGWKEFELGNYDKCLYYSREALKLDNSLWFVQFNVALVYLVQNNPMAFEKYKFLISRNNDKRLLKLVLQDIFDYEKKYGLINNSESIKLLIKSKL